jgi:hypothetical protein
LEKKTDGNGKTENKIKTAAECEKLEWNGKKWKFGNDLEFYWE